MSFDNGQLVLLAPSRFVAEYTMTHYLTRLTTAVLVEAAGIIQGIELDAEG